MYIFRVRLNSIDNVYSLSLPFCVLSLFAAGTALPVTLHAGRRLIKASIRHRQDVVIITAAVVASVLSKIAVMGKDNLAR